MSAPSSRDGKKNSATYGIVGDGKVASHFAHYFKLLNLPYRQWSRKRNPHVLPEQHLEACSVILLLVSDPAIVELAERFRNQPDLAEIYHFSGALVTPHAKGAHPLMTFGPELYELDDYRKIPFVLEEAGQEDSKEACKEDSKEACKEDSKDARAQGRFKVLFPTLPNPLYSIQSHEKARYHALCAMAGSFTGFLWAKLFTELQDRFGITPQAAVPFLLQLSKNLAAHPNESQRFFTGPIARGDYKTIEKHLHALEGDSYRGVYEAFCQTVSKSTLKAN
jgi:hypothetical protein